MSSAKDYSFEIITNSNQNSVKFIVRNKPSSFVRHVRLPLACVLLAWVSQYWLRLLRSLLALGVLSRPRLYLVMFEWIHHSLRDCLLVRIVPNFSTLSVIVVLMAVVVLFLLDEASDTLMVMKDMGVQMSSKSKWRPLNIGRKGKFVPISEIIDIVIHEGFHGFGQVIFYMCVLTRDKERGHGKGNGVKVIFPNFLPRKEILLQVWKLSRQMLYGNTRRHYRHVPGQGLREVKHLHEE